MNVPIVSGNDSMPIEPSQDHSPTLSMENVPPKVHSQDVPDKGMTVTPDIPICTHFYTKTCGGDKAQGNPCSTLFTLDYIIEMRAQCSLLSHDELILCSWDLSPQQCLTVMISRMMDVTRTQQNEGISLCHSSTMAIMSAKRHFSSCMAMAENDWRLSRSIIIRRRDYKCSNMGTARVATPHHAMPFAAIRNVVSFLCNYAEENAILLPARSQHTSQMTSSCYHQAAVRR